MIYQGFGLDHKLFSSHCTHVEENLALAWPQYEVRPCWNVIGQTDVHRSITELENVDRQTAESQKLGLFKVRFEKENISILIRITCPKF
jgi:hypothetical protein